MKSFIFKLFLLITFLFLSSGDLLAQVNWIKYPGNPVLTGQPGTWYAYTTMNSVLYNADSSRYEMWFTAGAQIGYPYTIGFARSSDGISWNVYSPNPVLTPTPGEWDAYMVLAPYVLRENGQYKMWYTGCATSSILNRIGYATSPDGINWTKHQSNPVLLPGTAPWESAAVTYPCIMPYSNGYKMWYGGYNANLSVTGIGYATSPDGITWEKYANNPVLLPGASSQWDHVVFGSRVLFIDNNYYMFFTGETVGYQSDKIGLATSTDGLVWTKYPSNPVLQPTPGQWDGGRTNSGYVLLDADTLKMYYCGMTVGNTNMQLGLATSAFSPPILPGTYTVGTGGNFATIQDAFTKLETDGVSGNVTLELIDELYTAPTDSFGLKLNGPIPGAGPNSRVTIKPAENKNVTIQGSANFVLCLINTNYLTFDGVSITGPTTLTIRALYNNQYVHNNGLCFVNNSDYNIVRNTTFINESSFRLGVVLGFFSDINVQVTPDNNLIQSNFIKQAGIGIWVGTHQPNLQPIGNIIKGNIVGSETDSLISWGIQVERNQNALIEENIVEKIRGASAEFVIAHGINCYGCSESTIRNNIVHNVNTSYNNGSMGIGLTGDGNTVGNGNLVYNNMVYDINSSSSASYSNIGGIHLEYQNNTKIYYNSVYLSGTGANHQGSGALYIWNPGMNTEVKNNIFINTRDEGQYCASAIYLRTQNTVLSSSDFNVLNYEQNNYNCLVKSNTGSYHSLAEWQATGYDVNSYVERPPFISSTDLHISETIPTYLESRGIPITGIDTDFDGDQRNADSTDIGADEFNGIYIPTGIEDEIGIPTEFALEQNYPNPFNPSTKIKYSVPQTSQVQIKVFDVLGKEIETLVNEEKPAGTYEIEFNTSSLSGSVSAKGGYASGVYFYQLKAEEFIETKKMILLK
ncbi:MAG: T9SS type A sorting domain-containing protein [Ignavibacteriaceae bacterium]|nr:T9SS type A sorting domain-containing protein [Ignavibacteriaceae bacterium]